MGTLLIVGGCAAAMWAVERTLPRRAWPVRRRWAVRSAASVLVQAGVVMLGAATWDRMLPELARWRAEDLGLLGGAGVGYLAITLVYYWWHRLRHGSDVLWRWLHQLHHSPARLELAATFYKHPLEILANGVLTSAVLSLLVGATPEQAALAVAATGIAELFYHWNVTTPHWLGYLIQRPESHSLHHARGRHDCNFADLPLWDMLFGTFDNPREDRATCGFDERDEARLADMLLGRSVGARARRPR